MATVEIWVDDTTGSDSDNGSSFALAFKTPDKAIDWVNATWDQTSDIAKIYLCGDFKLSTAPSNLTQSGATTGQCIWQGRDNTNGDTDQQITIDADSNAASVFRWNTANNTFGYHSWRQITILGITGSLAAWEFSESGISRLSWYRCEANTCGYGWQKVDADTAPFCKWVDCVGNNNDTDGWKWL